MRVLLVSCYELGHQPLALASPAAFLIAEGFEVECLDLAVEPLDVEQIERADFVGISIPMHTAIRLGVKAAERVRSINPDCHLCFYGLYASLNDDYLLRKTADSVIGAEFEGPLVELVNALCEDPCPWDCVGDDGVIGIEEFLAVLGTWGEVGVPCDLAGDGVGIDDFLKVLGFWGPCP